MLSRWEDMYSMDGVTKELGQDEPVEERVADLALEICSRVPNQSEARSLAVEVDLGVAWEGVGWR